MFFYAIPGRPIILTLNQSETNLQKDFDDKTFSLVKL
jgi:hypothetical protein